MRRAAVVWTALVLATVVSFSMVETTRFAPMAATLAIIIGAFKIRLIFVHFMDLTWEMAPFRLLFELWTIFAVVMILGMYWYPILAQP